MKRIQGDITRIRSDVVVNAANTELAHGGGTLTEYYRRALEHFPSE